MIRTILTIIILAGSIAAIVLFAAPKYQNAKALRVEVAEFEDALDKAAQLRAVREELQTRYNSFSNKDLENLELMMPSHVDNVGMLIDINDLATDHRLVLKDISVVEPDTILTDPNQVAQPLGTIDVNFSVSGTYGNFVEFLGNLERSLRLVDVKSISFAADSARDEEDGLTADSPFDFTLTVGTYWLRDLQQSQVIE